MSDSGALQAAALESTSSNAALISFALYLVVVFVLAWLSGQVMKSGPVDWAPAGDGAH